MEINKYIDHTLLKPEATADEIKKLCTEAKQYSFASVCINPTYVEYCKSLLNDSNVKVCTVVGFPLGAMTAKAKAFETHDAVKNGADEIDMVMNIGAFKSHNYDLVLADIQAVRKECKGKILKVILETCLLSDDEIREACQLCVTGEADFVKTSTGFNKAGATVENVKLMKETVGTKALVKAAGGIRDYKTAMAMIDAGASRIGASSGIKIVEESMK